MCGFCGILGPGRTARLRELDAMTRTLAHRGPDGFGTWRGSFLQAGEEWKIGFGHTRLAVLDPSERGHQPMLSEDGETVIVYNGEIFNYPELRGELLDRGLRFRSTCDTEAVLLAYQAWGLEAFARLNGMFALAIWDTRQQRLILARDRMGIKPLHYSVSDGVLTFASELEALRAHSGFRPTISLSALETFLRYGWLTGVETIYEGTYRLLPGHLLLWERGEISIRSYWRIAEHSVRDEALTFDSAVDQLDRLLGDVIEAHLLSDVPLGAFLSGGVDSSTVVALMKERATGPVRTYSIGFRDTAFDEAPQARRVAHHLDTEHTELYVDSGQAREVIYDLPTLYDEPHADPSAIPTVLLCRMTRESVTVALSGDGGDELFGGYDRYGKLDRLLPFLRLPGVARRGLQLVFSPFVTSSVRNGLRKLSKSCDAAELAESFHVNFDSAVLGSALRRKGAPPPSVFCELFRSAPSEFPLRKAMYAEARTYLNDDVLVKVDRASMSVGLEARVPLLDHRVVEFAFGLPLPLLRHGGQTKAPLRAVLYRRVPRELIERPKKGFGFPIRGLLGRELGEWTRKYLSPARLLEEGLFDPDVVSRMVASTSEAGPEAESKLWRLLCFERWLARNHRGEAAD